MNSPITWLNSRGLKIACCSTNPLTDSASGTPSSVTVSATASATSSATRTSPAKTATKPTIVFCGGFKSNMQGTKALALQRLCSTNSMPYVRFDYSGHGRSEGEFAAGNIDTWLGDALTVVDAIDNSAGVVLVGSSMGAWIATLVALQRTGKVKGLVTLAAAPDFTERLLSEKLNPTQLETLNSGQPVCLPSEYDDGSPYPITLQLIDNSRQHCLLKHTHTLPVPVRMLHGTDDVDVPCSTSIALLNSLECSDARLTLIKNADHRLSAKVDLELIATTVIELLEQINKSSGSLLQTDCREIH